MMSDAAMFTWLLEFITLRYGVPIMRLRDVTSITCVGVSTSRLHAKSLPAATALKRDHNSAMRWSCCSMLRPAEARSAVSNIGYT